ncbi:MAG: nucleoside hydrolase [Brevinema sp.]
MNYWIDTDAGVDDAVALLWAFKHKLNIVGISAVAGNLPVKSAVNNVKALLEHSNVDIPVYRGADASFLANHINAEYIHGKDLGPIVVEKHYNDDGHVLQGLANYFQQCNEPLTLITIGPLTNIATFLIHYPEYHSRITKIITMGGGSYGNIAPYGEFNIYVDPEAAHVVFNSDIPMVLSDLDITDLHAYFTLDELEPYTKEYQLEDWSLQLMKFRIEKSHPPQAARIYDVLPMIYIFYPELFEYDTVAVDIQLQGKMRGFTAYDYANNRENNHLYPEKDVKRICRLRKIDRNKYISLLFEYLMMSN